MYQIKFWLFACFIIFTNPQTVVAETQDNTDEKVSSIEEIIQGLASRLGRAQQGIYEIDPSRSAVFHSC